MCVPSRDYRSCMHAFTNRADFVPAASSLWKIEKTDPGVGNSTELESRDSYN